MVGVLIPFSLFTVLTVIRNYQPRRQVGVRGNPDFAAEVVCGRVYRVNSLQASQNCRSNFVGNGEIFIMQYALLPASAPRSRYGLLR